MLKQMFATDVLLRERGKLFLIVVKTNICQDMMRCECEAPERLARVLVYRCTLLLMMMLVHRCTVPLLLLLV